MEMSTFEIRANNYLTAIASAHTRMEEFGYDHEDPKEVLSRIYGSFIVWLIACEEARAHERLSIDRIDFHSHIISALPLSDNPNWRVKIEPAPESTLRERAEGLWGIRVAMTHGDGDISKINSSRNAVFARNAINYLPGIELKSDRIYIDRGVSHVAVRTILQIQEALP